MDARKKELDQYKIMIRHYTGQVKRDARKDYELSMETYKLDVKDYKKMMKDLRVKEKQFKKTVRKEKTARSMVNLSRSFEIRLKDDTKVMAEVESISRNNDLALLKIKGFKTPFLNAEKISTISQGMRVYVIGSPLGESDSITSGVITKIKNDQIIIDATVMPGNSGGPLLNKKGDVIGVNTLRLEREDISSGFGVAIPMEKVLKDFGKYFK